MRPALYFNLAELLDRRGCVVARTAHEHRLAEFLTDVIAAATQNVDGPFGVLRCRRRPGRKPCAGFVVASFGAWDEIYWLCPHCSDHGAITNWQGSFWDLSDGSTGKMLL